jgi:hypothetical protein
MERRWRPPQAPCIGLQPLRPSLEGRPGGYKPVDPKESRRDRSAVRVDRVASALSGSLRPEKLTTRSMATPFRTFTYICSRDGTAIASRGVPLTDAIPSLGLMMTAPHPHAPILPRPTPA